MNFEAVRVELLAAVAASGLAGLGVAPELPLRNAVRRQHYVGILKLLLGGCAFVTMVHNNLDLRPYMLRLLFCSFRWARLASGKRHIAHKEAM